jgi:hypothetical protein
MACVSDYESVSYSDAGSFNREVYHRVCRNIHHADPDFRHEWMDSYDNIIYNLVNWASTFTSTN